MYLSDRSLVFLFSFSFLDLSFVRGPTNISQFTTLVIRKMLGRRSPEIMGLSLTGEGFGKVWNFSYLILVQGLVVF